MALLRLFQEFVDSLGDTPAMEEIYVRLVDLRAQFMIEHAIRGFNMDWDDALELLHSKSKGLTAEDREKRDILVAAVKNMIEFSAVAELQALDASVSGEGEIDEGEFERYNSQYANTEKADAAYAMGMAAAWVSFASNSVLTFMTQRDERVRPWHAALDGTTYPKSEFPEWLIPPIEHGCRCFLVDESGDAYMQAAGDVQCALQMPKEMNPTFKESVCKGGRIFSKAHPYFKIPKSKDKKVKAVIKKLQKKWLST